MNCFYRLFLFSVVASCVIFTALCPIWYSIAVQLSPDWMTVICDELDRNKVSPYRFSQSILLTFSGLGLAAMALAICVTKMLLIDLEKDGK